MRVMDKKYFTACMVALAFNYWGTEPVAAADYPAAEEWNFAGEVFFWGAGIKGTVQTGEDIDVPLHDIVDALDFGFMGSLAARKNKWSLAAYLVYVDLGGKKSIPFELAPGNSADFNLDLTQFITTAVVGYKLFDNGKSEFNMVAGGRYNTIDLNLRYHIGESISGRLSESGNVLDFIVGAQGRTDLNDQWYINYYADIGTGDSDMTWQALAAINYRFNKVDVTLGYSYLDWDFKRKSAIRDMSLSGPYAGIKFRF